MQVEHNTSDGDNSRHDDADRGGAGEEHGVVVVDVIVQVLNRSFVET